MFRNRQAALTVREVKKPHRISLTYGFLCKFCEYLRLKTSVSAEEFWELKAMYLEAVRTNVIWAWQVEDVKTEMSKVARRNDVQADTKRHTDAYVEGYLAVMSLVYSPVVEPWSKWERVTEDIDITRFKMLYDEYQALVDLIKLHGVEVTNSNTIQYDEGTLFGNPNAKNFIEFDELLQEIEHSVFGVAEEAWKQFIGCKIESGFTQGILSEREREFLHAKLSGADMIKYTAERMKRKSIKHLILDD